MRCRSSSPPRSCAARWCGCRSAPARWTVSWSRSERPDADGGELKPVLEVTGRLPEPLLELAVWIAEGTASTLARALALVVPPRPPKRRLKPVAETVSEDRPVTLTEAQQAAVDAIERARTDGAHEVLLHGVTGSGKTEVYLRVDRARAGGWAGRDRAGAGDRADAADRRRASRPVSATPWRCCTARSPRPGAAPSTGASPTARRAWWWARARRCSPRCRGWA